MLYSVTYGVRPTFYLDPNVQGIVSLDHARRVAASVLGVSASDVSLSVEIVDWPRQG